MTNEEYVAKIQAGQTELYAELWEKLSKHIWFVVKRYWKSESPVFDPGDLMQQSYFGFVKAVERYDLNADYSFYTALDFYVSNVCRTMIYPRRREPDPIHNAGSLDIQIIGDNKKSETFLDTLKDTAAEQQFVELEESIDRAGAMAIIEECLKELPERTQRVIIGHYCYDVPFVEFDKEKEGACRQWSQAEGYRGLDKIRAMLIQKGIRNRADAEAMYYRQKGVKAFFISGTSVVEDIVELREKMGEEVAREVDKKLKLRRDIEKLVEALKKISQSDRDILIRHYLQNEPLQVISRETEYGIDWASGRVKKVIRRMNKEIDNFESGKDIRELLYCIPKETPDICKNLIDERKAG